MGLVLSITAVTKNAPLLKAIPTRLLSFLYAFCLLVLVNIHNATFECFDLVIYAVNAIMIASSANGISDANSKNSVGR